MMVRWSGDLFSSHRNDNPGCVDDIYIEELSIDDAVVVLMLCASDGDVVRGVSAIGSVAWKSVWG